MGQEDLSTLLEMGFDKARVELAVKRPGGLQEALDWLERNQDKPLDELQAEAAEEEEAGLSIKAAAGETAKSIVCTECGKKFKSNDLASFHATKSGHTDFSESTEEIAPLTEEEKKARLEELKSKLAAKRATQAEQDKEEAKRNEKIRQKATKETQDLKEELQRKEQIKLAAKKRQEKADELAARKAIKDKIEADKAERKRKAEAEKAAREGRVPPAPAAPAAASTPASAPKPAAAHATARLKFDMPGGSDIVQAFPADTTLFEVAQYVGEKGGITVTSFKMTFPMKKFDSGVDFGLTLKEAGLVPSARLTVC